MNNLNKVSVINNNLNGIEIVHTDSTIDSEIIIPGKKIIDIDYKNYLSNFDTINRNDNNDILCDLSSDNILKIVPIVEYNNNVSDNSISELIEKSRLQGPKIDVQPSQFFRPDTVTSYTPGNEIFVSDNTITVLKGNTVALKISVTTNDISNLKYEWKNSVNETIGNDSIFEINTDNISDNIFEVYCIVSDSIGSIKSDSIKVNILDLNNSNILLSNLVKNSCGENGLEHWIQSNDIPESIGSYSINRFPAYNYHRIYSAPNAAGKIIDTNMWYPKPEAVEANNDFLSGKIVNKINTGNYFRGGIMKMRDDNDDTSSQSKSSYQIIDLSDYANLIDGKVYGVAGLNSFLYAWLGTRADQGDISSVEFIFYDANDNIILNENGSGGSYIISDGPNVTWATNIVRNNSDMLSSFIYKGGVYGNETYTGLNHTETNTYLHGTEGLFTIITGKLSDIVSIPKGTRSVRITKYFKHVPIYMNHDTLVSRYDLLYRLIGPSKQYISEALITGINFIMYPDNIDFPGAYLDMLK